MVFTRIIRDSGKNKNFVTRTCNCVWCMEINFVRSTRTFLMTVKVRNAKLLIFLGLVLSKCRNILRISH